MEAKEEGEREGREVDSELAPKSLDGPLVSLRKLVRFFEISNMFGGGRHGNPPQLVSLVCAVKLYSALVAHPQTSLLLCTLFHLRRSSPSSPFSSFLLDMASERSLSPSPPLPSLPMEVKSNKHSLLQFLHARKGLSSLSRFPRARLPSSLRGRRPQRTRGSGIPLLRKSTSRIWLWSPLCQLSDA